MDGLRFEITHEFKVWWKRILSSFIAVIIVDAFCCFVMEHGDTDQLQFCQDLAEEMIHNSLDCAPRRDLCSKRGCGCTRQNWKQGDMPENPNKRRRSVRDAGCNADDDEPEPVNHVIMPLKSLQQYADAKDARLTCRICKANGATLYCESCGENCHGQYFALCSPFKSSTCLSGHCQTKV